MSHVAALEDKVDPARAALIALRIVDGWRHSKAEEFDVHFKKDTFPITREEATAAIEIIKKTAQKMKDALRHGTKDWQIIVHRQKMSETPDLIMGESIESSFDREGNGTVIVSGNSFFTSAKEIAAGNLLLPGTREEVLHIMERDIISSTLLATQKVPGIAA